MPPGAESSEWPDADALVREGLRLRQQERNTSALAAFDRALQMEPGNAGAWLAKALLLDDLDRVEAALATYDRLLQLHPGHAVGWSNRAGLLMRCGRVEEALDNLDRALAADPEGERNALLCLNKGLLLWQGLDRPAEALAWLQRARAAGFAEADEAIEECRKAMAN